MQRAEAAAPAPAEAADEPMELTTTLRVTYADVDRMGVVYYGNYLRYFEVGRAEYLRQRGRSYLSIEEEEGVRMPVVESYCHYLKSATYDERLTVATRVVDLGRVRVKFGYRVLREGEVAGEDELLADGFTVHACVDLRGKLCRMPEAVLEVLR